MKFNRYIAITASAAIMISAMTACSAEPSGKSGATTTVSVSEETTAETSTATENDVSENADETSTETTAADLPAAKLPDDIYSFTMDIDGIVYAFPMTFDEFTSYGWKSDLDMTEKLEPNEYSVTNTFKKGNFEIYAAFFNFGKNDEPCSKCPIGGITVEAYNAGRANSKVRLPKGIEIGTSSLDDVIAAYGEPTDKGETSSSVYLTYSYEPYQEILIFIDKDKQAISKVEIKNFIEKRADDTNNGVESVPDVEMPAFIKNYSAPTELGNDYFGFTAEFDGVIYKLPAPVSEFIANGWKIKKESSDSVIAAKRGGKVSFIKGNESFDTYVHNYSNSDMPVEFCSVTKLEAGKYKANVPMKIQNNIEIGMSEKDLLKILGNDGYEKSGSTTINSYKIQSPSGAIDRIVINAEDGVVYSMEMQYEPSNREFGE